MKFRNRFMKYGCSHFNNSNAFVEMKSPLICFADGDGDNSSSNGGDNTSNDNSNSNENENTSNDTAKNNNSGIAMTDAQFDKWLSSQNTQTKVTKNENQNRTESAYDRIKKEEQNINDKKSNDDVIRSSVKFEMTFDKFIEDNKSSFDTTVKKLRDGARNLHGLDLQKNLSCTAAKSFFASKDNLSLLPESEQTYIKDKLIGIADNAVDSKRAWQLVNDAMHIKNRINQSSDFRKNGQSGGHGDNTNTPNVTAYLEKCKARGKPKAA